MFKPGWWRDFFTGIVVDFWLAATNDEMTRAEVDFLESVLELQTASKILDVPCGGGRHAIELAARGYQVTGVDISDDFLAAARKTMTMRNVNVTWEQREMTDLPWTDSFDAAFCFGNSFGYLDDAGNAEFFQSVARCLKPGGRFVLDTSMVAECFFSLFQERRWMPIGDMIYLSHGKYDPAQARLETDYTFIRDGQSVTRTASTQIFLFRDLMRLVKAAGFSDVQSFGSLGRDPFRLGSQRLLLVAQKR